MCIRDRRGRGSLRHRGGRGGAEGDWMGLLMLACVSLETFATIDPLRRRSFGEVVVVDDVGLIDAMD